MKRYPDCRPDYFDDMLSFCLEDGTGLVYGVAAKESATAILHTTDASGNTQTRAQIHTTDQTAGTSVRRHRNAEGNGLLEK